MHRLRNILTLKGHILPSLLIKVKYVLLGVRIVEFLISFMKMVFF